MPQPGSLCYDISHTTILGFGAGPRDSVLVLGRQGDEAISKEYGIAQGGLAGVRIAGPVNVGVDN